MNISDLWKENAEYVYGICMRYVRDNKAAEDIRQEVFLKVMNNKDSFREQASVRTWLYSIAFRCCLDYFRTKRRQRQIEDEYSRMETFYLSDSQIPVWKVGKIAEMRCPMSQLFIELHFGDEWSRDEIANVFGFSTAHVSRKINIGLEQLEKLL